MHEFRQDTIDCIPCLIYLDVSHKYCGWLWMYIPPIYRGVYVNSTKYIMIDISRFHQYILMNIHDFRLYITQAMYIVYGQNKMWLFCNHSLSNCISMGMLYTEGKPRCSSFCPMHVEGLNEMLKYFKVCKSNSSTNSLSTGNNHCFKGQRDDVTRYNLLYKRHAGPTPEKCIMTSNKVLFSGFYSYQSVI